MRFVEGFSSLLTGSAVTANVALVWRQYCGLLPVGRLTELMMREFFHGWRRKAGCVVLLTAAAVMGGHLRSHYYRDWIQFHASLCDTLGITSSPNCVQFVYRYTTRAKGTPPREAVINWNDYKLDKPHSGWEWSRPHWSKSEWEMSDNGIGREHEIGGWSVEITLPYIALTMPLALLAACLMLWKPRKRMKHDA